MKLEIHGENKRNSRNGASRKLAAALQGFPRFLLFLIYVA
ncbi:hypothetical protein M8C21_010563, partial [Ambrosia artemisiifolia]